MGKEAVGEKGSKGRHLLDSLWASPSPAETTVGFRASWGTRQDMVSVLNASSVGAGGDGMVSLLRL